MINNIEIIEICVQLLIWHKKISEYKLYKENVKHEDIKKDWFL
jgi:hypothetical protein